MILIFFFIDTHLSSTQHQVNQFDSKLKMSENGGLGYAVDQGQGGRGNLWTIEEDFVLLLQVAKQVLGATDKHVVSHKEIIVNSRSPRAIEDRWGTLKKCARNFNSSDSTAAIVSSRGNAKKGPSKKQLSTERVTESDDTNEEEPKEIKTKQGGKKGTARPIAAMRKPRVTAPKKKTKPEPQNTNDSGDDDSASEAIPKPKKNTTKNATKKKEKEIMAVVDHSDDESEVSERPAKKPRTNAGKRKHDTPAPTPPESEKEIKNHEAVEEDDADAGMNPAHGDGDDVEIKDLGLI